MAATDIITYSQSSTGHGDFKCSRRTAAHLDYTKEQLKKRFPFAVLVIIQGCYNRGVGASEGTHDYDCCLDIRILNMDWLTAQAFLRSCGWAAWVRWPWQGFDIHIHMISLGFAKYGLIVGKYVDGGWSLFGRKVTSSQVEDYYNHAYGLEGMHEPGSDKTWYPKDINATIFDYEEYMMEYKDWSRESKDEFVADVTKAVVAATKNLPARVWAFVVHTGLKKTARATVRETWEKVNQ